MRAQSVPQRSRRGLCRPAAFVSVVVALGLALGGCGGGSTGGATKLDKSAKVSLTWWTGQSTDAEKVLESLAKEFHKAHPNVTINVSTGASTTDDLLQKLSATFASGKYPDISYAYGSWAGELGKSGRTLDFTNKVKASSVGWSELPEAARLTATPGDQALRIRVLMVSESGMAIPVVRGGRPSYHCHPEVRAKRAAFPGCGAAR